MTSDNIEAAALRLPPAERARLVEALLKSLEDLSTAENEAVWAEEAGRRDASWGPTTSRPADVVLRDARDLAK